MGDGHTHHQPAKAKPCMVGRIHPSAKNTTHGADTHQLKTMHGTDTHQLKTTHRKDTHASKKTKNNYAWNETAYLERIANGSV
jgi:hypothetical protein